MNEIPNKLGQGFEYIEINPELQLALDAVGTVANNKVNNRRNVSLIGKAGTGKSTIIDILMNHEDYYVPNTLLLGTTGVAANNIMEKLKYKHRATTIHRAFGLGIQPITPGNTFYKDDLASIFKDVNRIIIDESSMADANLVTSIIGTLMEYKGIQFFQTYADVLRLPQIILLSDPLQLEAVVKDDVKKILSEHFTSMYFFHSWYYKALQFVEVSLNKCYRTKDFDYVTLANKMRTNSITQKELLAFNKRHVVHTEEAHWDKLPTSDFEYITLAGSNRQVDAINSKWMGLIDEPEVKIVTSKNGDVKPTDTPVPDELILKKGATVMLLRNDPDGQYVNGSLGKVIKPPYISPKETKLWGSDREMEAIIEVNGTEVSVKTNTWEIYNIQGDVVGTIKNLPLKVAFALTFHKSQGLQFESMLITPAGFACGMLYTGISRIIHSEYMSLTKPIQMKDIKVSKVALEYTRKAEEDTLAMLANGGKIPPIVVKKRRGEK